MGILPALIGTITTVIAYTLLFAGVYKLFAIATDLNEIKTLLKEQKIDRDTQSILGGRNGAGVVERVPALSSMR